MMFRKIVTMLVVLPIIGFIAALPAAIVAALFGTFTAILLLYGIIIVAYLPQKMLTDSVIKGQSNFWQVFPTSINPQLLPFILPVSLVFIPIIWSLTGSAFFLGLIVYMASSQNLVFAIISALIFQQFNVYRASEYEKRTGNASSIMGIFENMQGGIGGMNFQTFTVDASGKVQQRSYSTDTIVQDPDDEFEEARVELLMDENPPVNKAKMGRIQHDDETVITFDDDDNPDVITINAND